MLLAKLKGAASNTAEFILELIFPSVCTVCGKLYAKSSFNDKTHICPECMKKVRFTHSSPSVCKKCSRPIDSDSILCAGCQVSSHCFDVAFSCILYENEMRSSLLTYKFNDARYKYRDFAEIILAEAARISPFPKVDIICSVPVSKKRRKQRGFDHVAPLAKYISKKSGVPYCKGALLKVKDTPPQSILSFRERQLAVKGAFKLNDAHAVRGKSVLLLDDIYTTGATVSEAAKILKRAGAEYVAVMTLCITPDLDIGDDLKI